MPFPAFWGKFYRILKIIKRHKIHKRRLQISGLGIYIDFLHSNFHINYDTVKIFESVLIKKRAVSVLNSFKNDPLLVVLAFAFNC